MTPYDRPLSQSAQHEPSTVKIIIVITKGVDIVPEIINTPTKKAILKAEKLSVSGTISEYVTVTKCDKRYMFLLSDIDF